MSVLSDHEILAEMGGAKPLIRKGSARHVGPACYELRAGPIYYDLTEGDQRIDCSQHGTILIKPGHRVVLISLEEIDVPTNMLARVTSKGSLFSVGLAPVSTYADPGFAGNLGLVTQNVGDKYLVLPIGEPIAKVDFCRLSQPCQQPYRGQHGFQTQIWPIRHDLQKSHAEVSGDPRVADEADEASKVIPAATVVALQRIRQNQAIFFGVLFLTLIVNAAMLYYFATDKRDELSFSIATNLIASLIFAVVWHKRK